MVLGNKARGVQAALFTPFARAFLAVGLTPNAVTIAGTIITSVVAMTLLPTGHLVVGSLVLGVLVLTDSIDGIMARLSGRANKYGEFLDSSLDRVADAAIFAGVLLWYVRHTDDGAQLFGICATLACLAFGGIVPYVRAKAESLGVQASVGVAERADRILVVLVATLVTGLGAPALVMSVLLTILALLSLITVAQRLHVVEAALRGADA